MHTLIHLLGIPDNWLIALGVWLARLGGWSPPIPPAVYHERVVYRDREIPVEVPVEVRIPVEIEVTREVARPVPMPADGVLVSAPVMYTARRVVEEVNRQPFRNGEQKRHNALTAMLNHFPEDERQCGLAIELAVREIKVPVSVPEPEPLTPFVRDDDDA